MGAFYFDQSRYSDAANAFLRSTELAPGNYLSFFNLGSAYVAQGRYPEAIAAFNRSIALRPSSDAYGDLGYTYTLMNRYRESISALQQALKLDNHDWMVWGNLADALYWSVSRRGESVVNYRKAISIANSQAEINPEDAPTLAYLANYTAMLGDQQAAFGYLQKALALAPSNGEVLFRAAVVHNDFNQREQALSYLSKAVQAGYSRTIIRDSPDFSNLRQDQQFHAIVAQG